LGKHGSYRRLGGEETLLANDLSVDLFVPGSIARS
jgi:hypothetical protein